MKLFHFSILTCSIILSVLFSASPSYASDPEPLEQKGPLCKKATGDDNVYWGLDYADVTVYLFNHSDQDVDINESELGAVHDRVSEFYTICSNGKFDLRFSVHPEKFTLSRSNSFYAGNFNTWKDDYAEALMDIGVDVDEPGEGKIVVVTGPKIGRYSSAAGYPLARIYDSDYDYDCIRHELGHCFGLRHAQGLEGGNSIVGTRDHEAEHHNYGDVFDVMGEGDEEEHFNIAIKNYFNWFDDHELIHVISNGTYRLYTHDQDSRSGEIIGLTLTSGNGDYTYWIEFRTQDESSPGINSKNGVQVHLTGYMDNTVGEDWYRSDYAEMITYLLDMTPNSQSNDSWHANDFKDAELLVGETFEEPDGAFTITPVAVSENVDDEMAWIDVEIYLENSVAVKPIINTSYRDLRKSGNGETFNMLGQQVYRRTINPMPVWIIKK